MKNFFQFAVLLSCAAAVSAQNAPENQIKTVDLGLPSGTLWTTQNLGARYTADYGDCFAWGETAPKENFSWNNYKYSDGTPTGITKYDTDGKRTLEASDDPATVILGPSFSTPTKAQWEELIRECIWIWTYSADGRMAHGYMVYKAKTPKDKGRFIVFKEEKENQHGAKNKSTVTTDASYHLLYDPHIFIPASEHNKYKNPVFWRYPYGNYWSNEIIDKESKTAFRVEFDAEIQRFARNANRWEGGFIRAVQQDGEKTNFATDYLKPIPPSKNAKTGKGEVDLGLPSRTLWTTCNIGAENPWESGDYFAWGETTPKAEYNLNTYKYCKNVTHIALVGGQTGYLVGDGKTKWTKYVYNNTYGEVDNKTILESADDAATANLGAKYSMPTLEEWSELVQNCYWVWTENYNGKGVDGFIVYKAKSAADKGILIPIGQQASVAYKPNDKHIFLPTTGYCENKVNVFAQGSLWYWSSTLKSSTHNPYLLPYDTDDHARCFYFNEQNVGFENSLYSMMRYQGVPVRAVRRK